MKMRIENHKMEVIDPNIKRRRMATPPFSQEQYQPVPPMGIPTSPSKSNIRTPRTPLDTPRTGEV